MLKSLGGEYAINITLDHISCSRGLFSHAADRNRLHRTDKQHCSARGVRGSCCGARREARTRHGRLDGMSACLQADEHTDGPRKSPAQVYEGTQPNLRGYALRHYVQRV